jgi:thioredoxin-like negative regulator of GroEL
MDIINSIDEINDLINNNEMLLIYFGSETCGVCNSMMPKIKIILEKFKKIKSVKVEPEKSLELSAKYNVFAIPVIILFIQGKETIREARIISIENLEQKISRYYKLFYEN